MGIFSWLSKPKPAAAPAASPPAKPVAGPSLEDLLGQLHSSDISERQKAAQKLGPLGDRRAVEPLLAALKDANGVVVQYAIDSLGRLGDPRACAAILPFTHDTSPYTRSKAACALARLKSPHGVPLLIEILKKNPGPETRHAAVWTLVETGDSRALEAILKATFDSEVNFARSAIEALGKLGDSRAAPRLTEVLTSSTERSLREAAAKSLTSADPKGCAATLISALQKDKDFFTRRTLAEMLGKLKCVDAVEPLIQGLPKAEDQFERPARIKALGEIGDGRAVTALLGVAYQGDHAKIAVESLEKILAANPASIGNSPLAELVTLTKIEQIHYDTRDEQSNYAVFESGRSIVDCSRIRELAKQESQRPERAMPPPQSSGPLPPPSSGPLPPTKLMIQCKCGTKCLVDSKFAGHKVLCPRCRNVIQT